MMQLAFREVTGRCQFNEATDISIFPCTVALCFHAILLTFYHSSFEPHFSLLTFGRIPGGYFTPQTNIFIFYFKNVDSWCKIFYDFVATCVALRYIKFEL